MPEKKRTYEADTHLAQNVTLQQRPKKTDNEGGLESSGTQNGPRPALPALPSSPDVVLRLIKTLKKI
jgi:hypothetical protein